MKYRKRQYLQWFWWSSRLIMSADSADSKVSSCVSVMSVFLLLSLIPNNCIKLSVTFVDATELTSLSPRVVFTKQGPVQGFLGPGNIVPNYHQQTDGSYTFRHYSGRPVVEIFKGIPYASPPVGNLRYESPTPPPLRSRTQIYSANVTKPPCPVSYSQILNRTSVPGDPIRALKKTMEQEAEDCLYLDIFLPLNTSHLALSRIFKNSIVALYDHITGNKNRGTGLPVLAFVNSQVDDPEDPFDGSSMAAIGNIIVINIRYRASVLGFVKPGFGEDVRSNFGLWDLLAALQWIKENIAEFGGDDNISLAGYDLDATLAGLISLSPVSQAYNGLFHRLILLNGSPFAANSINQTPQKTTFHLARNLKCSLDERSGDLGACFRRIPTPKLLLEAQTIGGALLTNPFAPINDGTLIPHDVSREDQRYSQAVLDMLAKYDLLCGIKEGAKLVGKPILRDIDLSSFVNAAIKITLKLEADVEPTDLLKREAVKAITDVYGLTPPMREVVSDFLVVYPLHDLLKTHSASTSKKNTFFYVFKEFDPLRLNKHNEISYIFSNKVYNWKYHSVVPDYRHLVSDARAEELKPSYGVSSPRPDLYPFVLLISLLSNFVRSGDPNVVDPNERSLNNLKPWPKFGNSGRYLELGKEVEFPSGYRKQQMNFWGREFTELLKTFANQSSSSDPYNYDRFPYFPPKRDNFEENQKDFRESNRYPEVPYSPPNEHDETGLGTDDSGSVLSGIGQNTVVLIGALLLLLNFLCFIGLFYQRERLKKTEIQLRRRFLDARQQNPETSQEMETASSFERAIPIHSGNHIIRHTETPARDAMSETETENGFGPDFLGPNYDPRTKVNRWMNMQNANRMMLSKDNSFDNPSPSIHSDFHVMNRRETDMPDPSLTVLPLPPPLQPSNVSHHHPPLHIQVTSLQRNSHMPNKMMPMPIQILPPLPYQEPYQPSASLVSDIPYADSRNTSPLTIPMSLGYSNTPSTSHPHQKLEPSKMLAPTVSPTPPPFSSSPSQSTNLPDKKPDTSRALVPGGMSRPSQSPTAPSPTDQEKNPSKRASVVIVRDLDPIDTDLDMSETKLVPVKTGTLKRSVGVDTGHDGSPAKKENGTENQAGNKRGSSQIRVTFSEKV